LTLREPLAIIASELPLPIDRDASPLSLDPVLQQALDGSAHDGAEDGTESTEAVDGTAAGRPPTAGDPIDDGNAAVITDLAR
jgi:hypothetical protein